jgi:hypothetical protein
MSTAVAVEVEELYVKTRNGEVPIETSPEAFKDAAASIGTELSLGDSVVNNSHLGHICGVAYANIGAGTLPYYCFKRNHDGRVSLISHEGSRHLKGTLSQAS